MLRNINRVIISPNKSIFRRNIAASIRYLTLVHNNPFYSVQRLEPTKSFSSGIISRNFGSTIYDAKEINETSTNKEKYEHYLKAGFDLFCKVYNLVLCNNRENMKMHFAVKKKHFYIVKMMKRNAVFITLSLSVMNV